MKKYREINIKVIKLPYLLVINVIQYIGHNIPKIKQVNFDDLSLSHASLTVNPVTRK